MTKLPDAEALVSKLITTLRPVVNPRTAMVGIVTGGAWLAERLHAALGKGVLAHAAGSCHATIGHTSVVCGVRAEMCDTLGGTYRPRVEIQFPWVAATSV